MCIKIRTEPWVLGGHFSRVLKGRKKVTIQDLAILRNPRASNDKAKELGRLAKEKVEELLDGQFTVHTGWADGRGSAKFKRYYGFVTTSDGRDLAEVLVEAGLARAYGVYRRGPNGTSAAASRERLRDLELQAAVRRAGVWAITDWDQLPAERQAARDDLAELEAAKDKRGGPTAKVDPNTATRDELMSLPGIGETKALAIIEGRTQGRYRQAKDLARVSGIGPQTVEKLQPFLQFGP
jgi:competence ComEA-like helix-hairpin-helix protein